MSCVRTAAGSRVPRTLEPWLTSIGRSTCKPSSSTMKPLPGVDDTWALPPYAGSSTRKNSWGSRTPRPRTPARKGAARRHAGRERHDALGRHVVPKARGSVGGHEAHGRFRRGWQAVAGRQPHLEDRVHGLEIISLDDARVADGDRGPSSRHDRGHAAPVGQAGTRESRQLQAERLVRLGLEVSDERHLQRELGRSRRERQHARPGQVVGPFLCRARHGRVEDRRSGGRRSQPNGERRRSRASVAFDRERVAHGDDALEAGPPPTAPARSSRRWPGRRRADLRH